VNIHGRHYRTIWLDGPPPHVQVIDQRALPQRLEVVALHTAADAARAIQDMTVRGAGLIGATAAWGMYLAALHAPATSPAAWRAALAAAASLLKGTRPTAVNLAWAVERMWQALRPLDDHAALVATAAQLAQRISDDDADMCRRIGTHGQALIAALAAGKGGAPVNILTHCNAGWLAFVDYGSALAPVYAAHDAGLPVHVWVDETRPRNQGARLTAWELGQHGVPHTLIVDNAGGHLMQHGLVDLVITGADRVTRTGDAANKIGTYLKALAAQDNGVPFYVALPSSTFDLALRDGVRDIPIEQRDPAEVTHMEGVLPDGTPATIRISPADSPAANYGFDVTPARLITGLITERGVCPATEAGIVGLFGDVAAG
jgi:methylthioribose-1-phosphate isomerase